MNITCIEKKKSPFKEKKRVAAYARVSSGKDAMLHSLAAQIDNYKKVIIHNPDWEFAGVFADEALTGTKDNRPQFQKMLAECEKGNIDIILTKSLSRFSRNTVTTLTTLRKLKEYGVDVWFERENIHSLSSDGEFMLTLLSSVAQEESLSASENQKWKIRKNFKEGIPTPARILGYRFVGDTFEIIDEEADIVRRIYDEYLSGKGLTAICKGLSEDKIPTKNGGRWYESSIRKILTNEKYVGDLLLQKTFYIDHISKKQIKNTGELPQVLVTDSHTGIIDRETFNAVQAEMESRAKKHPYIAPSAPCDFTGKIVCENCGKHYRRKKIRNNKIVWICSTFNSLGKAYCASQQIPETILRSLVSNIEFTEIRIPCHNTVKIITVQGEEIIRTWQNPSRAESWTDEMKEKARQRRFANA